MTMIPNSILQAIGIINPKMNVQNMQGISTPDEMAQYLLNSGMVNQNQVNQARQMWNQQPNIRQMVADKFKF